MGKRRKYSKEFKQEAVQMVSVPGVTLSPDPGDAFAQQTRTRTPTLLTSESIM